MIRRLLEQWEMWNTRRMLNRHFRHMTRYDLMEMSGVPMKKCSEEFSSAFMASKVFAEIRCQCGVTYIAGETLTPILREHYAEVARQGGSVQVVDGLDMLHTAKLSGKLYVLRCPCLVAKLADFEQFVRANREAIQEYLTVTETGDVDPPNMVNRLKKLNNETD